MVIGTISKNKSLTENDFHRICWQSEEKKSTTNEAFYRFIVSCNVYVQAVWMSELKQITQLKFSALNGHVWLVRAMLREDRFLTSVFFFLFLNSGSILVEW